MALRNELAIDQATQMDLLSARSILGIDTTGRHRLLDDKLLTVTEADLYDGLATQLHTKTKTDSAVMTVCSKNSSPFQRAGKIIKEKFMENYNHRLPTGFLALDKHLQGGIHSRSVTQVLGPQGGGKSTFVHHFIRYHLESAAKNSVLFVTPISDSEIILKRVLTS